jgi:hypothetical protein
MKKVLIVILVVLAAIAAYSYFWDQTREDKTYVNNVYNYEFKYDFEWQAVTSRLDAGEVLFGPGATSDSGNGGVELMGNKANGQTLAAFVKAFNAGVGSGSTSETETTINNMPAIVSILPGPGNSEVKSVAFANGNQVFNVYIGYDSSQKTEFTEKFDQLTRTFKFIVLNQVSQEEVMDDSKLLPGTKRYTSEALGITFTYNARPVETFEVKVTEIGNKIYLHGTKEDPVKLGKMIEVFSKNSNQTLSEAIKERFLKNLDPKDCFVVDIASDPADPRPSTYTYAEISYPPPTDSNDPFWVNGAKCPQPYSKTNAVQYFMANSTFPSKYVFLQLGQDSIADDGTQPGADGSRRDWSASIRIVK